MPASPADPDKPLLPRRLYLITAGLSGLLIGWMFAYVTEVGVSGWPMGALYAAPVAVSWYRPVTAWWMTLALLTMMTVVGIDYWRPWFLPEMVVQSLVLFTVAVTSARRVTAAAFLITLGAGSSAALWVGTEGPYVAQGMANWALGLLAATLIGYGFRTRRLSTLRIAEEHGRRRILEERARIARELHDVVAHHMSVIAVQAATFPNRAKEGASAEALREFREINTAARASLTELRQLLGVLRGDRDDPPASPGLEALEELVESARRAGTPVRLELPERSAEPAAALSHAAYRIVQEALSNVVKHAGGAPTVVTVGLDGGALVLEVVNEPGPGSVPGAGYGLVGMRERVAALSGELSAGVRPDGRYAVRAVLPEGDR
ncbi:sensor histidine kinase [Spongiactinospora rosea]|uniref:histidine kinase n=1 Tax=Spongiactinospora rosea TaxID=2248750 RepID=A0A366LR63_9ACTN|nr:histidine kinase [Spongiactinospora rosea]RBQ15879.1 sensor histidine kinase [Spongiactinospora rosea]